MLPGDVLCSHEKIAATNIGIAIANVHCSIVRHHSKACLSTRYSANAGEFIVTLDVPLHKSCTSQRTICRP